jgi:hypothetical protein
MVTSTGATARAGVAAATARVAKRAADADARRRMKELLISVLSKNYTRFVVEFNMGVEAAQFQAFRAR